MCVHYLTPSLLGLEDLVQDKNFSDQSPLEIFPRRQASVLFWEDGALEIEKSTWGFKTSWSKAPLVNTRLESSLEKKEIWAEAFSKGRLLIPSIGFYEVHRSEKVPSPRSGNLIKQQYLFDRQGDLFFMAGISHGNYFSLVTSPANSLLAPVHDRMPLLVERDEIKLWFSGQVEYFLDRERVDLQIRAKYPSPEFFNL